MVLFSEVCEALLEIIQQTGWVCQECRTENCSYINSLNEAIVYLVHCYQQVLSVYAMLLSADCCTVTKLPDDCVRVIELLSFVCNKGDCVAC